MDGLNGADFSAIAAIRANRGIDDIGIPLADSAHRTSIHTASATGAFFSNHISQSSHLLQYVFGS